MAKVQTTIRINNDTSNPINVEVVLEGEKEKGLWSWATPQVLSVELVVSDKEGVNITANFKNNPRALAFIAAQAGAEEDQVIDALEGTTDENVMIDEMLDRRAV